MTRAAGDGGCNVFLYMQPMHRAAADGYFAAVLCLADDILTRIFRRAVDFTGNCARNVQCTAHERNLVNAANSTCAAVLNGQAAGGNSDVYWFVSILLAIRWLAHHEIVHREAVQVQCQGLGDNGQRSVIVFNRRMVRQQRDGSAVRRRTERGGQRGVRRGSIADGDLCRILRGLHGNAALHGGVLTVNIGAVHSAVRALRGHVLRSRVLHVRRVRDRQRGRGQERQAQDKRHEQAQYSFLHVVPPSCHILTVLSSARQCGHNF